MTTATTLARDAATDVVDVGDVLPYYEFSTCCVVLKGKNKAKRNLVQKYKSLSPPNGKRRARRPNQ